LKGAVSATNSICHDALTHQSLFLLFNHQLIQSISEP
jgi:hypothetical protein